jgi:hypothetical protein
MIEIEFSELPGDMPLMVCHRCCAVIVITGIQTHVESHEPGKHVVGLVR